MPISLNLKSTIKVIAIGTEEHNKLKIIALAQNQTLYVVANRIINEYFQNLTPEKEKKDASKKRTKTPSL